MSDVKTTRDRRDTCHHDHIDNDTGNCVECGEQMESVSYKAETITSAPNIAECANPACLAALKDGTYDDASPPAGCTNPNGVYVPGMPKTITSGYSVTYTCRRCHNNGTIFSPDGVEWECGKVHRGDYIRAVA